MSTAQSFASPAICSRAGLTAAAEAGRLVNRWHSGHVKGLSWMAVQLRHP